MAPHPHHHHPLSISMHLHFYSGPRREKMNKIKRIVCRLQSAFQLMGGDFGAGISRLSNDKLFKFSVVNILFVRAECKRDTHMTNDT